METSWESELAVLLNDLLAVQDELLATLARKRQLLVDADAEGLADVGQQEGRLMGSLQECLKRREELLARAAKEGLPSKNIRALSRAVPRDRRGNVEDRVKLAKSRTQLLQHHSLTNWVLAQRSLLHLSQLLEIIATGGRLQPTYGEGEPVCASGGLVDRAA